MTMSCKRPALALALTMLATAASALAGPAPAPAPPKGWFAAGSRPQDYAMGIDRQHPRGGKPTGYIRSIVDDADGFGTFMHKIDAAPYRGKRVRLTAEIKTERLSRRAGLWMRIDGPTQPL